MTFIKYIFKAVLIEGRLNIYSNHSLTGTVDYLQLAALAPSCGMK